MTTQELISIVVAVVFGFMSTLASGLAIAAFKFAWTSNGNLIKLGTKVDILFDAWQKEVKDALDILHKPHPEAAKVDAVLDKIKIWMKAFQQSSISDTELMEFIRTLEQVRDDINCQPGDRLAASKILNYVEMQCKIMQLGL